MNILFLFFISISGMFFQNDNIAFHLESRTLTNEKVIVVKADVSFQYREGKMVTHYIYPFDYIVITNKKGEAQVYDPKKNTLSLKRGLLFSTDIDIINLFLTERYADLGMKDMNYKMVASKKDKGYIVSTWLSEKNIGKTQQKIELAHDNSLPVYMAIYDENSKISKKIYYSNYSLQGNYYIPIRITEISYIANGDSIINKKEYSSFKLGLEAQGGYANFKIPQNAQILK
jgi:hypothetical protein